jgi:hypothetical protein
MIALSPPLQYFVDNNGQPLNEGYIYVGAVNDNPETAPIEVYWDVAATQPAAQPLRTVGGAIVRNGVQANIFVPSDYSMTIKNKSDRVIHYSQNSSSYRGGGGTVTPEQFGAVGNATHDDSLAWKAMFSYLSNIGGGYVQAKLKYLVNDNIDVACSNVTIDGCGIGKIYASGAGSNVGMGGISVAAKTNVTLCNFDIFLPRSNLRDKGFCIQVYDSSKFRLLNVRTDGGTCGCWTDRSNDVVYQNVTVTTTKADGLHIGSGSYNFKIIGCTITDAADDSISVGGVGLSNEVSYDFLIANNLVRGSRAGAGVIVYNGNNFIVSNNEIRDVGGTGIGAGGSDGAQPSNYLYENNRVNGCAQALKIPNSYWYGTNPASDPVAPPAYGAACFGDNGVFKGNVYRNVKTSAGDARDGMVIGPTANLTVKDNSFIDIGGRGVIVVSAGTSNLQIVGNDFNNVTNTGILLFAAQTNSSPVVISYNTFGIGQSLAPNAMIQVANTGTAKVMITFNTSSAGRGIAIDTTTSTNVVSANNSF